MTYKELYEKAAAMLDRGEITLGDFNKMVKPLDVEIHPEPHWIPCSAELPKTNDPVNVTYINHNPGNYYAEVKDKPYTATAHFHKGQWYWYSCTTQDLLDEYGTWIPDLIDKDVEILAYMPLPEPFKGVTE